MSNFSSIQFHTKRLYEHFVWYSIYSLKLWKRIDRLLITSGIFQNKRKCSACDLICSYSVFILWGRNMSINSSPKVSWITFYNSITKFPLQRISITPIKLVIYMNRDFPCYVQLPAPTRTNFRHVTFWKLIINKSRMFQKSIFSWRLLFNGYYHQSALSTGTKILLQRNVLFLTT